MKTILDRLIDEFHERALPTISPREAEARHLPGKVNVVAGMRRAGKTSYCYQQMSALLSAGLCSSGNINIKTLVFRP